MTPVPRRRLGLFGAVLAVVGVVAGVALTITIRPWPTPTAAPSPIADSSLYPAPGRPAPPLDQERSDQIARDLRTASPDSLRDAIALPAGRTLGPPVQLQLRLLGLTLDPSTFHDNADGTATVQAHVAHPIVGMEVDWTLHLVDTNGQWKISMTAPTAP